ncbi:oxidoreductase [Nakamurella endophytica]|uniref:Oxidoreductase n=2 Tax=Nakamurella endophytica TaxID=1748367 RepID=A0A917SPI6_9ACTN|nr:NADP-dependent oxidoreductase [Nakamurella endophytica]GGL92498.1 oxidoreductase [Nakamurella endophytica]
MTYDRYGDDSVLHLTDLPTPKVGPGEVLVRVRRAAVNPVDWKVMAGGLDELMDAWFPVVPGCDAAGVVERVGPDTTEFAPGDGVMTYARKDVLHAGTFAEYVTIPARAVARKPASLDFDAAAALPLAGLTAWQVLTRLGVDRGTTVLVHGAAGGVGSLGVQIAAARGARVIGTASAAHHDHVRGLGADAAVEYGEGLAERVRRLAPDGVDVVADFVGGVLPVTTAVLRPGGRHGSIADPSVEQAGGHWFWVRPDGADLAALGSLADSGRLRVPVAAVLPLEELAEAFARSRSGHTRGKIVLAVADR